MFRDSYYEYTGQQTIVRDDPAVLGLFIHIHLASDALKQIKQLRKQAALNVTSQLVVHNCNHRFQAKDGEKNHHEHIDRNILTYNENDPPCSSSTSYGNSHCRTILSSLAHICRLNMT